MTTVTVSDLHSTQCWRQHDACALQAAADLLDVRMAHARTQRRVIRVAQWRGDEDAGAVELARQLLTENHGKKWKAREAAS